MMEFIALISGAFFIGFAAQTHCVGMCGPVIGILGMNNAYKRIPAAILYNLGRISTYTLLGVIGGLIAASVSDITLIQYIIRYVAGAIMIFIALQLFGLPQALSWIERPFQSIWKPIQKFSQRFFPIRTAKGTYLVGMIWGLLPCGAVYGPLAVAMGAGSVAKSAAIMFAFGLGTLPIMLGLAIFGNFVGHFFAKKGVRMIAGLVVLIMAIYYLGWIAPQDRVTKRAEMVSTQTEKIRSGEQSATDILTQMQNMGHGHSHGDHGNAGNHDHNTTDGADHSINHNMPKHEMSKMPTMQQSQMPTDHKATKQNEHTMPIDHSQMNH